MSCVVVQASWAPGRVKVSHTFKSWLCDQSIRLWRAGVPYIGRFPFPKEYKSGAAPFGDGVLSRTKLQRIRQPAGGADCRPSCRRRSQSGRSGLGNPSAATRRFGEYVTRQAVRTAVRAAAGAASRAGRGLATRLRRHAASANTSPGRRCGLPSELPPAQPVGQVGAWQPVCGDTPLRRIRHPAGGADCRPSCRRRSQSGRSGLGNPSVATRRLLFPKDFIATHRLSNGRDPFKIAG